MADVYGISNVRLHDIDRDGDLDLVASAGHHGRGVYWYVDPGRPFGGTWRCPNDRKADGTWRPHTVDAAIRNPEGLAVVDLDKNGRAEVVACELDFDHCDQPRHLVYVSSQPEGQTTG